MKKKPEIVAKDVSAALGTAADIQNSLRNAFAFISASYATSSFIRNEKADKIWRSCIELAKVEMNDLAIATLVFCVEPFDFSGNQLSVEVQDEFAYQFIVDNYSSVLKNAIDKVVGPKAKLLISIKNRSVDPFLRKGAGSVQFFTGGEYPVHAHGQDVIVQINKLQHLSQHQHSLPAAVFRAAEPLLKPLGVENPTLPEVIDFQLPMIYLEKIKEETANLKLEIQEFEDQLNDLKVWAKGFCNL